MQHSVSKRGKSLVMGKKRVPIYTLIGVTLRLKEKILTRKHEKEVKSNFTCPKYLAPPLRNSEI